MYAAASNDNHATSGAHANPTPGTVLANKYKVVNQCGTGNFARVFECVNTHTNERVAVKLLKHGFERDADFECDILNAINRHDMNDDFGVVKLIERFEWRGHAAISFKLKGRSLRSMSMPVRREDLVVAARDLADSLSFLHFTCRAVHTDLKPENVLEEVTANKQNRRWALCDLGSASFYTSRLDTDLITTRPYRAPEVVLQKGWSYAADTWSLGCILYELRTGRKMFDAHNDAAHLEAMQSKLGPLPGASQRTSSSFGGMAGYGGASSSSRFRNTLRNEFPDDSQFVDLLEKCLAYDPASRIKCSDIARHPFVTSASAIPHQQQHATTTAAPRVVNGYNFAHRSASSSRESSPLSSLGSRTGSSNASPVNYHHNTYNKTSSAAYSTGASAAAPYGSRGGFQVTSSSAAAASHHQFNNNQRYNAAPSAGGYTSATSTAAAGGRPQLISPIVPNTHHAAAAGGSLQSGAAGYGFALGRRY